MAASPKFKVFTPQGEYEASCKSVETAAAVVSFLGNGATIRYQRVWIVWREGSEEIPASESYDRVATIVLERIHSRQKRSLERAQKSVKRLLDKCRTVS